MKSAKACLIPTPNPSSIASMLQASKIIFYYKCVIYQAVYKVWPDMQPVWLNKRGRE